MSLSPQLGWLTEALEGLDRQNLRRERRIGSGLPAGAIDFGANDYLGLAGDPRLSDAAAAATGDAGWGAGASPVVSGRTAWHARLEERIARFEGTESALFFTSGYAANTGVIPALVDVGDALYADAKNHASLIDGCRLARAERFVYPHADADQLAQLLRQHRSRYRRRLIVTDGLFSMDGDFAPLPELAALAREHDAMLLIDEAHATGVWGERGRGSVEHFAAQDPGIERAATVRVGTLSKALGSAGGFVAGPRPLIDWLANRARPYVFSTSPPPALAAAAIAAIDAAEADSERRRRCRTNAAWLRDQLAEAGWDTTGVVSQVLPLRVGTPERALALSQRLAEQGLFVPAIRPPSVPEGESLLRVSVTARHTQDDLARLVRTLTQAAQPD